MSQSEYSWLEPPNGSNAVEHAPDFVSGLDDKLMDMTLHDGTGDPRDEGYMDEVREIRDWLSEFRARQTRVS